MRDFEYEAYEYEAGAWADFCGILLTMFLFLLFWPVILTIWIYSIITRDRLEKEYIQYIEKRERQDLRWLEEGTKTKPKKKKVKAKAKKRAKKNGQ